jgi:DICT domain-containing protein
MRNQGNTEMNTDISPRKIKNVMCCRAQTKNERPMVDLGRRVNGLKPRIYA